MSRIFGRNGYMLKAAAGVVLTASVLGACAVKEVTEDINESVEVSETSASETTVTETETTYDIDAALEMYAAGSMPDYTAYGFESTQGKLDGQDEYMRLRQTWGTALHLPFDDLSDIGDDDLIALAQSYADQGYDVYDLVGAARDGDYEYEFTYGFGAESRDSGSFICVKAYKMNEELFEYFILNGSGSLASDEGDLEDDGTCITRSLYNPDSGYSLSCEYNRDSGIALMVTEEPRPEYWTLLPEEIDDDSLRAAAQKCVDDGYVLRPVDNMYFVSCEPGFCYQYGNVYVEVYVMDEITFDEVTDPSWAPNGSDGTCYDDGNTVTVVYDLQSLTIYEYDRATGIARVFYTM